MGYSKKSFLFITALLGFAVIIIAHIYIIRTKQLDIKTLILLFNLGILLLCISLFIRIKYLTSINNMLERKAERLELSVYDAEKQSSLLHSINEIIDIFSKESNLEDVLNRIVDTVGELLKANIVILKLYSEGERKFFTSIIRGRTNIEIGDNIENDVIMKGKSFLVNNLYTFYEYKKLAQQGFHSMILSPLMKQQQGIGFIGALSDSPRYFSDTELRLLTSVAVQAGLIVQNAQLMEKTRLLSIIDGLTNLYNLRHFQKKLEEFVKSAETEQQPFSLAIGDIDFFKTYNDINGHPAGNVVLRKIADLLKENTKGSDFIARYGGEEFVIVLPSTTKENAVKVVENIRKKIQEYKFENEEKQPNKDLTMTFGVATFLIDTKDTNLLIEKADAALYYGKNHGKNQTVPVSEAILS
jgi:diguanylate cyclase (GGDEF)-like protein